MLDLSTLNNPLMYFPLVIKKKNQRIISVLNICLKRFLHYLGNHVNMFSITEHTTSESSRQFHRLERRIKHHVFLSPFFFVITARRLSSGLHLHKKKKKLSPPFSALTISAPATPFILLWRQANLVLCACSLPQKLPGFTCISSFIKLLMKPILAPLLIRWARQRDISIIHLLKTHKPVLPVSVVVCVRAGVSVLCVCVSECVGLYNNKIRIRNVNEITPCHPTNQTASNKRAVHLVPLIPTWWLHSIAVSLFY